MRIGILTVTCVMCMLLPPIAKAADEPQRIQLGTRPAEIMLAKITVSNLRKSLDFYTGVLGLKEIDMPGVPRPDLDDPEIKFGEICLNFSGSTVDPFICLIKQRGAVASPESAKLTWVGIKVPDVRAVIARVKAAGLEVRMEAIEFLGVLVGLVGDPDGYSVEIFEQGISAAAG